MNTTSTRMKTLKNGAAALLLVLWATGCETKTNEKTEAATDSVALHEPAPAELNSDQSTLLKTILGPEQNAGGNTVLRGVAFGDPVSKVKATETFEMFEELPDHLGYTSETAQLETIDVQYFLTSDKKVNKIMVDVYLNSSDATKQLWNASKQYFNDNNASPKEEGKKITWNNKSIRITMEDVSEGKDYGLKFQFFPADKNALAAN